MDEREKKSEEQERIEVAEEGIERREEIEERPEAIEEAVEERCEEDIECHSSAKRARVCATFTDSQEISIVEFVKQHPELYDKEHTAPTVPRQEQKRGSLGRNICRTEATAL